MTAAAATPDYDGLVAQAFEGARLACGASLSDAYPDYPARVRVLAGAALFRGGWFPAKRAARDCRVGDQSRLSPSQVTRCGVTDEDVAAVITFLRSGVPPAATPDPRPGSNEERASAANETRLPEAIRLYVEEGLSLEETGARLVPPLSGSRVHALLHDAGVTIRPRGTQAKQHRDGRSRNAPQHANAPKRMAVARHGAADIEPGRVVDLAAAHPAVVEGRSLFGPKMVVGAHESARLLVSGHNNTKLGKQVLKGDRAGWPIFHLTLEERATCPRSCPVWAGCMGNAMPFARRHRADAALLQALRGEIAAMETRYPDGFLVRLHTLGDFFSVGYVLFWAEMLAAHPALHVFGYTARRADDEDAESRKIAEAIAILTQHRWNRFAIRTSHAEPGPQRSVVVMADPGRPDLIMCPAQAKATEACATCGLCWAETPRDKAIGFLKHGMKRRARRMASAAAPPPLHVPPEFDEPQLPDAPLPPPTDAPVPVVTAEVLEEPGGISAVEPQSRPLTQLQTRTLAELQRRADPDGLLVFRVTDVMAIVGMDRFTWRAAKDGLVTRGLVVPAHVSRGPGPTVFRVAMPGHQGSVAEVSDAAIAAALGRADLPPHVTPPVVPADGVAPRPAGPSSYDTAHPRPAPAPAPKKAPPRRSDDRMVRMKPVNARIVRWSRQQIAFFDAPVELLADCFEVDAADLHLALAKAAP